MTSLTASVTDPFGPVMGMIATTGQGGLLDVAVHPNFDEN